MKAKILFTAIFGTLVLTVSAQLPNMDLAFTAENNQSYVKLDSIRIINRSLECDTTLYWPDTVLSMEYTGVNEPQGSKNEFYVLPCYPNPVSEKTTIPIIVPDKGSVDMIITNVYGRLIMKTSWVLDRGIHSYCFTPGSEGLYFFIASNKGVSSSIKILASATYSEGPCTLEYLGSESYSSVFKLKDDGEKFDFHVGNELLNIGYSDTLSSAFFSNPYNSESFHFQFAYNIPCPGTPVVEYEGQTYNTVQIFSQCWLKENLNVGMMVDGWMTQSDNGIIEKYCYKDKPVNCDDYGALYQWHEMMQYTEQEGVQGICPPGWHLPADKEWIVLEGVVDSHYGVTDTIWDGAWVLRGHDAGFHLKSTTGWDDDGGGSDLFGFKALPGGDRFTNGQFYNLNGHGFWWTSTQHSNPFAYYRLLYYYYPQMYRNGDIKKYAGMSVRCVRN